MTERIAKNNKTQTGFTLIEIMITIVIIAILTTIVVFSFTSVQKQARDAQLNSRATTISESLEKYYQQNGSYPSCSDLAQDSSKVSSEILKGIDEDALTAPGASKGTNSITCSSATANAYYYDTDGSRYTLTYIKESSGQAETIKSRYDIALLNSSVIDASAIGTSQASISWSAVEGASTYKLQRATDSGFKNDLFEENTSSLATTHNGLTAGTKYHFRVMAKALNASSDWSNIKDITTVVLPPTSPTPVVAVNTAGDTSTWSWGAATCASGTSVRYQYRYTINNGYDSGLIATNNTSVAFTTANEGYTFTVAVQAQCYTPDASSTLTGTGSASYTRLMTTPPAPTITVAYSNPNVVATITPITCGTGTTAEYSVRSRTNDGTWGAYGAWTTSLTTSQSASQGVKYGYQAQAHCYNAIGTSTASTGVESTYVHTISTPSTPVVGVSTAGATTTWSWAAISCASGTSVQYQYRYTINNGYDSGLVATTNTSVGFTTSTEGYTYTVAVQASCKSAYTSSAWSTAGSNNYYRPITYTLTIIPGSNGSVNTGGTYTSGSTPTITATANSGYKFDNWSGSTGCSGLYSHMITMDSNKTCTANFVADSFTLTVNTSGVGSYTNCASEGGTCSFTGTTTVRYGAYSSWVYKYNVAGSTACTNANFGDPIPNFAKTCQYQAIVSATGGGTFSAGSSRTITASPSGSFDSWTGGTGCAGAASHSLTLNTNTTCTANFSNKTVDAPNPPATPSTPSISAAFSSNNVVLTINAVSCSSGTAEYQTRYLRQKYTSDSSWTAWSAWSTTRTRTETAQQGNKHNFEVIAHCNNGGTYSLNSGTASTNITMDIATPPAPTYNGPATFNNGSYYIINYTSYCPSNTDIVNGQFTSNLNSTGNIWGPHPFGFNDYWTNWEGRTLIATYWGNYQCQTSFKASPVSPTDTTTHNVYSG